MPAYAYPIIIKREPQEVRYQKEFNVDEPLTLSGIAKYVSGNETFWMNDSVLYVMGKRLETTQEVAIRVAKEEKYMKEYNKRKKNN